MCEFPEKVDWDTLNKWLDELDMKVVCYCPCYNRKEYDILVKKRGNSRVEVRAWPVLKLEEGYWFTGFLDKKLIDRLDEFKGVKFKIDVEPPFPNVKYNSLIIFPWLLSKLFLKGKNSDYMVEKVKGFGDNVLVSTFPLPDFVLKRWGYFRAKNRNYMFYSSFLPKFMRGFYRFVYRWFIRMNKDASFAVGLLAPGIFGNEPAYRSISEFEKDLLFMQRQGVQKVVVFRLGAVVTRGKDWLKMVKKFSR
jgi:hypothetical protein